MKRANGGGIAFASNTGFNLTDGSCLSPDAAWLALDRWRALTPQEQAGYPPLCPEFVIEVRSRTDSRRVLEEKMPLWMENGAQLAWLIDPVDDSVAIYRQDVTPEFLERPEGSQAMAPSRLRPSRGPTLDRVVATARKPRQLG